jgi:hypothetical protein
MDRALFFGSKMTSASAAAAPAPADHVEVGESHVDPVEAFVARASARATLYAAGEISLHEAVDQLQHDAVRDGLVDRIGQDRVQQIMAAAFAAVQLSDEISESSDTSSAAWAAAAAAYHRKRDGRQLIIEIEPERLTRARRLLGDSVSLERTWAQLNTRAPGDVPTSVLQAAEFLLQQKDPARFKAWLAGRSHESRDAIRRHLQSTKRPPCRD